MGLQIILFIVLSMSLTLIYFATNKTDKTLEQRKKQSENRFRENVLRRKLEEITKERVKYSKRHKIETICLQAGFRLSYTDFLIISIATAIISALLMGMVMHHPLFVLFFFILGFLAPKQVIVFLKNQRIEKMDKQIGSFMLMVLKRYENTKDFKQALELTLEEFRGEDPLYSELRQTVLEINLGKPVTEALEEMARRTGNPYMMRLADYYKISADIGTEDIRNKLLNQAYLQYEENRRAKASMKRELQGVKTEAYIMVGAVPAFALFQAYNTDGYIQFMTQETMGQIGTLAVFVVLAFSIWFINAKISAPLD